MESENNKKIYIRSLASISPLGSRPDEIWANYQDAKTKITNMPLGEGEALAAPLSAESRSLINAIRSSSGKYRELDDTALYAIYAGRQAMERANWSRGDNFGINLGSSRGATALFEKYHGEFVSSGKAATLSSPTTTLGNISSWVAHDLGAKGPDLSHSITCSTGLHALLNGVAWLRSGMCDKFMVGGTEASLTPFTIAQMRALKIYGSEASDYPCRALDLEKKRNSMILGEGAAMACLVAGNAADSLARIDGVGYATEPLEHGASLSAEALCFQRSMEMALGNIPPEEVDVIVMHAPGTIKGDKAEIAAIKKVFGSKSPALTNNKWKIGHTFGASGILSIEMASLMLVHQRFIGIPYIVNESLPEQFQHILVNAVGFGGNAVSVLLGRSR